MADKPTPAEAGTPVPRGNRGQFKPGNAGKKKGTVSWEKRKLAEAAREMFEELAPKELRELIVQNRNLPVKLDAIRFLADRAYGKAPQTVRLGMDPDSPEGILLKIAGQVLPGSTEGGDE